MQLPPHIGIWMTSKFGMVSLEPISVRLLRQTYEFNEKCYFSLEGSVKYAMLIPVIVLSSLIGFNTFANECPSNWKTLHPAWIWCDDFETDKTASYFEKTGPITRTAGAGLNSSYGMKSTWA